jgi:hypothetical protein
MDPNENICLPIFLPGDENIHLLKCCVSFETPDNGQNPEAMQSQKLPTIPKRTCRGKVNLPNIFSHKKLNFSGM